MKQKLYFFALLFLQQFMSFGQTLDQSNTIISASTSGTTIGQSFTPGLTGKLSKFIYFNNFVSSNTYPLNFKLKIYQGGGNTGTLLGEQSFTLTSTTPNAEFEIVVSSIINVTAGNLYTAYFIPDDGMSGILFSSTAANSYSGGSLYNGNSPFVPGDLYFKTFVTVPATHLNFGGSNDYVAVTTPYTAFTNKITVEFWMNPTILITPGVGFGQGTPNVDNLSNNVWLVEGNASGNGAISFYVNDNGTWRSATTTTATTLNTWQHYTCVADASGVRIYKDGVLNANSPIGISSGIFSNTNAQLHIGKDARYPAGSGRNFKGSLDEVRIWNKALTPTDITNTMNCELQSAETGLVAYYKFNQGFDSATNSSVTTLTDNSGNANNGTLTNFALTGTTSNWLAGSPIVTGTTCTTLNATNFEVANNIKMYPNPSNGIFTIETQEDSTVEVFDMIGKKILSAKVTIGSSNIDLSNYTNGIYLLTVTNQKGNSNSFKLIKQ